jgi:aromatic-amino-acid transaminase
MMRHRAEVFAKEAQAAKLNTLPYIAGFFLSIPAKNPGAVCNKLHDDNIFGVPLAKGVRIALCALPSAKIAGMPAKISAAIAAVDK